MNFNQPDNEPEPTFSSWSWWRKRPQILYGFVGWYLVNGAFYLIPGAINFFFALFLANIIVLIVLVLIKETRMVGIGILIALALNFLVSLVLGIFFNGVCFVPFYVKLF
jgi:hypothetical protein